jgi:hypothetical protein
MEAEATGRQVAGLPFVPWAEFARRFVWYQGEHVTLVGPTGAGKTTLALELLKRRRWRAILATKPKDDTLRGLEADGYTILREWPPPAFAERVVLWPAIDRREFKLRQRAVFRRALDSIYEAGAWAIYADELTYMIQTLRLGPAFVDLWQQGRSLGVSLVASMQRPAWVPLAAYSQASHLFFWRANDERDLRTIGGIGFADSRRIREIVAALPGPVEAGWDVDEAYAFLYINARSGKMLVSRLDLE